MRKFPSRLRTKKLIVFDLDGTLAPSKSRMDGGMSALLAELLEKRKIAVIGGGRYAQFQKQFLRSVRAPRQLLPRLFLFPTTSTAFYRYRGGWRRVYEKKFSRREKRKIFSAFARMFRELAYAHPKRTYGPILEDRGTQITFSALGQDVVARLGPRGVRRKADWKRKHDALRRTMMRRLQALLPEFSVRVGGLTSIDVTRKGIDKAYGIRQIRRVLKIPLREMLFVGDALYPGGNDYAVRRTGVSWVQVRGPEETKRVIRFLLSG
ncbi:MAG: HAD-IIB family hydrolase [Candidatus Liptonbacteria bacterium]|nr:HAD-IIB family hydrolase [Candidatus Liptonbacteria bacterium]